MFLIYISKSDVVKNTNIFIDFLLHQKMRLHVSKEEAIARVGEVLNTTNWEQYAQQVSWANAQPRCSPYEGTSFCSHWAGWILSGRQAYAETEEGEREYIEEIRKINKEVKARDIRRVLGNAPTNLAGRAYSLPA